MRGQKTAENEEDGKEGREEEEKTCRGVTIQQEKMSNSETFIKSVRECVCVWGRERIRATATLLHECISVLVLQCKM